MLLTVLLGPGHSKVQFKTRPIPPLPMVVPTSNILTSKMAGKQTSPTPPPPAALFNSTNSNDQVGQRSSSSSLSTKPRPNSGSNKLALRQQQRTPVRVIIVEKTPKEINNCWKNTQILTYLVVIISGIASAKSMGDIVAMFQDHCIFNATLTTTVDINGVRWVGYESYEKNQWGNVKDCYVAQFCPVGSMAVAAMLATFFAMCGRGSGGPSRNLPQPWRIVPVALLLNLVFVGVSSVHIKYVFEGFASFCRNIVDGDEVQPKLGSCEELFNAQPEATANTNLAISFYDNVIGAKVFAVISLIAWSFGLVILIVRCSTHADFSIVVEKQTATPEKKPSNKSMKSAGVTNGPHCGEKPKSAGNLHDSFSGYMDNSPILEYVKERSC